MTSLYIEMTPVIEKMRLYDKPGGYGDYTPYINTLDVMWKTRTEVWLYGMNGDLPLSVWPMAMALLRSKGAEIVRFDRRGVEKTYYLTGKRRRKEPNDLQAPPVR